MSRLQQVIHEIHRRSLWQVLLIYLGVSWGILEAVALFRDEFGLPDWLFSGAFVLVVAGFPIVALTALLHPSDASDPTGEAPDAKPARLSARKLFTWRRVLLGGALALVLLAAVASGYTAMRVLGIGPAGSLIGKGVLEERDRIVLADFENHTPDSTLGLVVTEAFRTLLVQSPVVRVVEREFVAGVLERMARDPQEALDYETARELAIREGLKAVVAGEVGSLGHGFVISARLVAAENGEVLTAHLETAEDGDAIIPAIDRLSRWLRGQIGESLKTIRSSPPLGRARTASLEALRFYTEGWLANVVGDYSRSIELSSRAIELDSMFASAYALRGFAQGNVGFEYAQSTAGAARASELDVTRAYELRDRLPLPERYWIEALYHQTVTEDWEKWFNALSMVLELRPDDEGVLAQTGFYYLLTRDYVRAEEFFGRLTVLEPFVSSLVLETQVALGKYDEAKETFRAWEDNLPDDPRIPEYRMRFAAIRGEYVEAEVGIHALREQHSGEPRWRAETSVDLATLARLQGRLAEAERHLDDAISVQVEQGWTAPAMANSIVQGSMDLRFKDDTAAALRRVEAALDSIPVPDRPYGSLVSFYASAGQTEQARAYLAEFEERAEYEGRSFRRARHAYLGRIAVSEGRLEEAIAEYRSSDRLDWNPVRALPKLAFAYDQAGEPDSALAVYERYVTTPWLYRDWDDSWWLAWAYERLGALYEQRGDTAKAVSYYGKFVELWEDADPEFQPRVETARRAIEALSPDG
jgi:tetratricopeptide (TPR) repeat protein